MSRKNARERASRGNRQRSEASRDLYFETHPLSWEDAVAEAKPLVSWVFRGQASTTWGITSTIERATEYFKNWDNLPDNLRTPVERIMLEQFRRRAHHYVPSPPADEDLVEWLALIQHHGGPTRLLDFTHSFYVAAFFAMERAEGDAAVWAVNTDRLKDAVIAKTGVPTDDETIFDTNRRHLALAQEFMRARPAEPLVLNIEPERMNERLSVQQGLFLCPCDLSLSFEQNLAVTFDAEVESFFETSSSDQNADERAVMKIVIARPYHRQGLEDLASMNVSARSLFPGLDGFARSLHFHTRLPKLDERELYPD